MSAAVKPGHGAASAALELQALLLAAHPPPPKLGAPKHEPTRVLGAGDSPNRLLPRDTNIARFASPKSEPARVMTLADDHPALLKGRTLFPSTLVGAMASPRFLVSGHNNPKLGKQFRKGPWTGMPLFHVTLEERATCPRSCSLWDGCYGNSMHLARRHDHRDPAFMDALKAEVLTAARAYPKGLVVRLHTLGDFYSLEYVRLWADLIDAHPNLRVFGYTARREDADDAESRQIARAIRWLTEQAWDVFAIRFSGQDGPQGTIVVREPDARGHVIMCPAQTYATAACVTCGLCAAGEAREKTIGFLLHGRKAPAAAGRSTTPTGLERAARNRAWRQRYERGEPLKALSDESGYSVGGVAAGIAAAGGAIRSKSEGMAAARAYRARQGAPP